MISGYCDEKFSSARELFENNLNTGFERGAAITVEIEGETVVDLWGGIDSKEQNTRFTICRFLRNSRKYLFFWC